MPFQMQTQCEMNWCWAAVSASVNSYFDPGAALSQCEIAAQVLDNAQDCCGRQGDFDKTASLDVALEKLKRLQGAEHGRPEFEKLKSEIDAGRPVCVRIAWKNGAAHYVALYGYRVLMTGVRTIEVADPWFPGSTQDFDFFPMYYHGGGTWTTTFFTKSRKGDCNG